jgi:hypothetical protein
MVLIWAASSSAKTSSLSGMRSRTRSRTRVLTAVFVKVEPPSKMITGMVRRHAATFQVTGKHPAAKPEDQY